MSTVLSTLMMRVKNMSEMSERLVNRAFIQIKYLCPLPWKKEEAKVVGERKEAAGR